MSESLKVVGWVVLWTSVPALLASPLIGWIRSRYGSRPMWALVLIGTPLVVALILFWRRSIPVFSSMGLLFIAIYLAPAVMLAALLDLNAVGGHIGWKRVVLFATIVSAIAPLAATIIWVAGCSAGWSECP